MTLLARAPREVYRVYSEEEFFGEEELFAMHAEDLLHCETGAGPLESVVSSATAERRLRRLAGMASTGPFAPAASPGAGERRLRRLVGVAALAGAVAAVGATFAAIGPWPVAGAGRRAAADSSATAPTRIAPRASVPGARRADEVVSPARRLLAAVATTTTTTTTGSLRPRGEHRRPGVSRGAGVQRWRGGEYASRYADAVPASRAAPAPVLARPDTAPTGVASANATPMDVAGANATPVDVANANAAPIDVANANAVGPAAATPQPQHAEFGFER